MSNNIIQSSFNAGEWSPALNARVDMQRYHSAAALLRNFFVDYRGGATTRPGSKYIIHCKSGTNKTRLIPFQASLAVSYLLEFGNQYLRIYNNGVPLLSGGAKAITNITQANPGVVTSTAHGFSNGDWVFLINISGMTQLNSSYFIVAGATANTFQLHDLNGNNVDTTGFSAYTANGTVQKVLEVSSPYFSTELAQLKFSQDVNLMILNHPNYPTYQLVLSNGPTFTLSAVTIGATIASPTGQAVVSTSGAGTFNLAYVITAVDVNGQESAPSGFAAIAIASFLTTVTNTVTWNAVTGAQSYNVYRSEPRNNAAVPAGSMFGLIGNCTATTFIDSDNNVDFSQSTQIVQNPFAGSGVQSVTVTAAGSYAGLSFPIVSFSGGGGSGAAAIAIVQALSATVIAPPTFMTCIVGDTLITASGGAIFRVTAIDINSNPTAVSLVSAGNMSANPIPANPISVTNQRTGQVRSILNVVWGVTSVGLTSPGTGYATPPAVAFSSGAATATSALGAPSAGNPTVSAFHNQRLCLMGPTAAPNQFNASQPSEFFNFNVTDPVQPDNAFQGTLNSVQLNTIQSAISQPQGLVVLTDKNAWLLNGGSAGSAISATGTVANAQIFNGAASLPPIVAVDDILYVQAKGSIVRDLIFNFQKQVYTGADISVQSSHLFYGYQLIEWAYAEEPFKLIWAVRSDGQLLVLTFLREQELVAWAHADTAGSYKSIATVTENVTLGNVDAIYTVVQRSINGITVQYIERFPELYFPTGATDSWQVDAGLQYNGPAVLNFAGAFQLANTACTGVATDDTGKFSVITVTVAANGTFSLAAPPSPATGYTRVTIGLAFTPQLTTLALDLGAPTVQGKRKKVSAVTARVRQTLGLACGRTLSTLKNMKDLIVGNVGTMSNTVVTDLVTSDARIIVDPQFDVFGQYSFQQNSPYPATILGVIPEIELGDAPK